MRIQMRIIVVSTMLVLASQAALARQSVQDGESLDPSKHMTQYMHENWSEYNGLPQSTVSAIMRTNDGYLWLGTQEGLVRYNGITFEVFDKGNTPAFAKDHKVETLFVDSKDRLWIGLFEGLVVYEKGSFTSMESHWPVPIKTVRSIVEDNDENIWIGLARDGIIGMDTKAPYFFSSDFRLNTNETLNVLLTDPDGSLWVGTSDGLIHLRNKLVKRYSNSDGMLAGAAVKSLYRDRQGTIWVGTDQGILNVRRERIRAVGIEELRTVDAQTFLEDGNGTLWIGTGDTGILRVTAVGIEYFGTPQGLTHQSVTSLLEDEEGSLWIGTDGGGLNRLREGKFTTFTEFEGLSDNMVWTVYEDAKGGIWIGTESGGVTYKKGGSTRVFDTGNGLSDNLVSGLGGEEDGTVWVGTYGGGLNRIKDGVIRHFTVADGLVNDAVSGVYRDRSGTMWFGTNGGVSRYEDGKFHNITMDDGLVSNFVTVITEDLSGAMWVGTFSNGLNRITDQGIETFTTEDGLGSDNVFALHVDEENTLWIGTRGGGLTRFRDDVFSTFTMHDGLYNDYIYQILESDDGHLWMTCNKGIFTVLKSEVNALMAGEMDRVESTVYDRQDGLKGSEMNGGFQPAGWKGADGRMWFPSIAGVAMIDPMDVRQNRVIPQVHVERFVVDGIRLDPNVVHSLRSGSGKIEFRFASLSYEAPSRIRYEYRLEGFKDEWETITEQSATYTNLDPGDYTFHVRATNNDGIWNQTGATVVFNITPQFYETRWFIVAFLLAGFTIVGLIYQIRITQLRKRHEELEEERDKARAANHFKSVILDNLSHEFRTPLTGILGYADILMAESSGDDLEFAGYIKTNGNRLLHTLDSLLELARVQRVDLDLEMSPTNLVDLIQEEVSLNRPAARERGLKLDSVIKDEVTDILLDHRSTQYTIRALIDNAIKFTDKGRIRIKLSVEKEYAVIRVCDTGIGIRRSDFETIFEPFKQSSEGLDRNYEGAGVGLTVARHLSESMNGDLKLESSGVDGSTFVIRLPMTVNQSNGHSKGHDPHWRFARDRQARSLSAPADNKARENTSR